MTDVYRQRSRSDEVVTPEQFRPGLSVWVDGSNGRELHICTGKPGEHLPLEKYLEQKVKLAAARAAQNGSRPGRTRPRLSDCRSFGPAGLFH